MALLDCIPSWSNDESAADKDGKRISRSDRLTWTITVDHPENETVNSVRTKALTQFGIGVGTIHPHDTHSFGTSSRVRRLGPTYYQLEVQYASPGGGQTPEDNPLNEPPDINYSFAPSDEPIDVDVNGKPIVTVTGEAVDPLATAKIRDLVITVTRNVPTFDPLLAWQYCEVLTVNSDTFLGFPPGTVALDDVHAQSVDAEDFIYFQMASVLRVRRPGPGANNAQAWWTRRLHTGFYELDDDGDTIRIVDANGDPMVDRVLLNSQGKREHDLNNPHFQFFQTVRALPFGNLGII